jgi:hypothetical protein
VDELIDGIQVTAWFHQHEESTVGHGFVGALGEQALMLVEQKVKKFGVVLVFSGMSTV